MDDALVAAFPPKYAEMIRRFRAAGRGDFVAEIVQKPGVNLCENEFRIDVRDAHAELQRVPVSAGEGEGPAGGAGDRHRLRRGPFGPVRTRLRLRIATRSSSTASPRLHAGPRLSGLTARSGRSPAAATASSRSMSAATTARSMTT